MSQEQEWSNNHTVGAMVSAVLLLLVCIVFARDCHRECVAHEWKTNAYDNKGAGTESCMSGEIKFVEDRTVCVCPK